MIDHEDRGEPLGDPRLLVVGAGSLAVVGSVLLGSGGGTVSTVVGGFAFVSAGALAKFALDLKQEVAA